MIRRTHALFLLVASVLAPQILSAQATTGTPPFGSYERDSFDSVNLANLNVHFAIPIIQKSGRGLPFRYTMSYDSSVWAPTTSGSSKTWQPVNTSWGWLAQSEALTGSVPIQNSSTSCFVTNPVTGLRTKVSYPITLYGGYRDAHGTFHSALIITTPGYQFCDSGPVNPVYGGTQAAFDGSGYVLTVNEQSNPRIIVQTPAGWTIDNPGSSTATVIDNNGNELTTSVVGATTTFTDTLGTTPLTVNVASSSQTTYTYTAPSGAQPNIAFNYTQMTVQTVFGCSGVTEYPATAVFLVTSVTLPDSTSYTFTYETTPNDTHTPHYVTGRIASVTLPTGGTISYTYTGGSSGHITCADGSASGIQRFTPDTGSNFWNYARTAGTGAAYTTTLTDPTTSANQTVIQFQGGFETQRQAYQGAIGSANLLKTIYTCYNTSTSPCTGTAITFPLTQRTVTDILPGTSNLQCKHIYKYNSSGSLTEQDDYDYGSGNAGPLLKKTAITYASLGNITKLRQMVTVTNGSGATVSQTNYNYDETGVTASPNQPTPQHTSVSGSRGNLTSINFYVNGTSYLTKRMTYYDTGKIQTVTDVNGAQTTYNYGALSATCGNSYATSVSEPLSLSRSMTWNCTGGVNLTVTDENSQTTTTAYTDPYFWRPASLTDPASATTSFCFGLIAGGTCTLNPDETEATLSFNSGNSASDTLATRDGLGRPHLAQIRETPGSTNFDTTETDYDAIGRPSRVTLPYVGTAGQTNSSAPSQTVTYDALSRTLSISDNSGGSRTFSYSQNDVYITRGPAPSGENTKRRQEESNGLGRLVSVCEITAGTTSAPAGTCAQNSLQTGYWTKYSYDALGRLTGVSQNAQSSNPQSRSYVYDLMGRLTSETNPESGTTSYVYDTDSTCGSSSGDLVKRTDAVGNVTCYTFDAWHRPLTITYPTGTYASVTPAKHFVYDAATVNGQVMVNTKSRLAEAYTCTSTCASKLTDTGYSYTVRGEPSDTWQSTPNSGGYYHLSETHWANGAPHQIGNVTGLPSFTFGVDGEGRPYTVSASSGQNPVTNTIFNAAGLPTSVTYGSADSDSFAYDPNTNRITQYQFTVSSQSETGALTWNANHTIQSQNITDSFNSSDTQNCAYSYDDLSRLASANCGTPWSQTFAYDAFGNISKSGTYSFLPVYKDTSGNTTNRFVSIPGTTVSYDADGNVLSDGSHTYAWDSSNKAITVDTVNATYDALGRMVEQNRSGTYTQFAYGPSGAKLAILSGQTLQKGLLPLPGGGIAVYNSSGLLYYGHPDHLGSMRLGSTPSRTILFDLAFAPFGETYAASGTTDPAFTGQRQDTVAGLYDFPERQYSTQGRWPAPDPAGLRSMHLSDPQTLNRYAYVRNNPLVFIDPQGLDELDDGDIDPGACVDFYCSPPDPYGDGGNGGADPTSGGDQGNAGGDCGPEDPACVGLPPISAPSPFPTPDQPFPAGLVPVDSYVAIDPNATPTASVVVTYQLVDQNGNHMLMGGAEIVLPLSNTNPAAGSAVLTTDSNGQIIAPYPAVSSDTMGFTNTQMFYYMTDPGGNLPNVPIETVGWTANTTDFVSKPGAPPGYNATGTNSLGQQNFKLPH